MDTIADYVNHNGKVVARTNCAIPADNGAFRYGYGLFETMLLENSQVQLWVYHMERLFEGMEQLYFEVPSLFKPAMLEEQILATAKRNKLDHHCRVRLQVFAGGGGLFSANSTKPSFLMECFPVAEEISELNENGLVLGIAEGIQKSPDTLSNLKSANALIYAMAARQARQRKWNDALITNTRGNIIESTIANIFWVKDGQVHTPPLKEGCIAGVMRRYLLAKYPTIAEAPLTPELLATADEVFLTNAIKKVKWVGRIGDRVYGNKGVRALM